MSNSAEERECSNNRTDRGFSLVSASVGFCVWGGWAWFVNAQSPGKSNSSALTSGLTQGAGTFLITLVMVRSVTWMFHRLHPHPLATILPAFITVAVTGSCMLLAHQVVGTANIARTIAPALTVAFLFNLMTTWRLWRQLHR